MLTRALALAILLSSSAALAENAGGLTWTPPAEWKVEAQRPMRVATYAVPAVAPDVEGAEVSVFYFGEGQGGSVEANVQRWRAQFDGEPEAKAKMVKVNGVDVWRIELAGTYLAPKPGAPPMGGEKVKKPGSLLLGAIPDGGKGLVFFKLVGPKKTVTAARKSFEGLVKSLKKQ